MSHISTLIQKIRSNPTTSNIGLVKMVGGFAYMGMHIREFKPEYLIHLDPGQMPVGFWVALLAIGNGVMGLLAADGRILVKHQNVAPTTEVVVEPK